MIVARRWESVHEAAHPLGQGERAPSRAGHGRAAIGPGSVFVETGDATIRDALRACGGTPCAIASAQRLPTRVQPRDHSGPLTFCMTTRSPTSQLGLVYWMWVAVRVPNSSELRKEDAWPVASTLM